MKAERSRLKAEGGTRLRMLAVAAALGLSACGGGDQTRTVVSDSGGPRIVPGSVAGAVALQLWQLRGGVSLGDWKTAHPDEPVSGADTSAVSRQLGEWCAAVQQRTQVGARIVTRSAFFYPPPPPANLAPPDSVPDLVLACRLGLIWVKVDAPDSTGAAHLWDSLAGQLATTYSMVERKPVRFWGSALWNRIARFQRGDIAVVAGLRAGSMAHPESPVAFAFAFLPFAGISVDEQVERIHFAPEDSLALDSAAALVRVDNALFAPLRTLSWSRPASGAADSTHAPAKLIQPLRRWLQATAGLPAPRRAAALYVADQVLGRAMCAYQLCDGESPAPHADLDALGARFTWISQAASWSYEHTWLVQARALDRDSPLGQRMLLFQMNHARDLAQNCHESPDAFRKVIDDGERYLARVPASPIAAEVHFQVGDAYRDIVALAHGAGDIYADSSRYGAEAGAAAEQALAHYRAAIRAGPDAPVARAAWARAWWLKAGLVPRDLRFYCLED